MSLPPLLVAAEELKRLLLGHVQQGGGNEGEYAATRRRLLQERRLVPLLPDFLKTDSTLQEVRRRAQRLGGAEGANVAPYEVRRDWLAAQFRPLLDHLQQPELSSVEAVLARHLRAVDSAHVRDTWDRAVERRRADPDGAITIARSLIEAVCKHILGAGRYDAKADLGALYRETARALRLTEDGYADDSLKQVMRGCVQVVLGVGEFRNKMGDAHGKGPADPAATALQAELAVAVAGATATFLIATWESRQNPAPV